MKTAEELQDQLNEVSDFLGIKDLSLIKESFASKFVSRENITKDEAAVKAIAGSLIGKLKTKAKQLMNLEASDIEGLESPEQIIEVGVKKYSEKIAELELNQGKAPNEQLEELSKKLEKTENKLKEEQNAKKTVQEQLSTKEAEWAGEKKSIKLSTIISGAKTKAAKEMIELDEDRMYAFEGKLKERFTFDLDENDTAIVNDSNGNRVQNPDKAGEFMTPEGAILAFAKEKDYIKKNNGGTLPASTSVINQNTGNQNGSNGVKREIPASALAHIEALKEVQRAGQQK